MVRDYIKYNKDKNIETSEAHKNDKKPKNKAKVEHHCLAKYPLHYYYYICTTKKNKGVSGQ